MATITQWTQLGYLLGWIEMLDAYQRAQNVDDKQRFMKKTFVTTHAIQLVLPDADPSEVHDFIKQFGELKPEEPLIKIMQSKIDRDNMMKMIKNSKFSDIMGGPNFV